MDFRFAFMTLPRGDKNNTRIGPGTIKSSCGRIFQNLDGFYIVGVDVRKVRLLDTVDNVKRRTGPVQGGASADYDIRAGARLAGCRGDTNTCDISRQGLDCVAMRAFGNLFPGNF